MRMLRFILLAVIMFSPGVALPDDAKAIAKLITEINSAAKVNKARMLRIMVINTDVAASTYEAEKAATGLSYGDLYVAHALVLATNKSFEKIVALKASGHSWAGIAKIHNVSLQGSTAVLREILENPPDRSR